MSWTTLFHRPVRVPDGKPLKSLADARKYLLGLPADVQRSVPAQTAAEVLLMAATKTGPILHAQIGMIQLIHGKPDGRIEQGKKPARKYRVLT